MITTADGAALLAAVLDDPDDDLARLAYADWLEESGGGPQSAHAALVRQQVANPGQRVPGGPHRPLGFVLPGGEACHFGPFEWVEWFVVRRGFVSGFCCTLVAWEEYGPAAVRAHPVTEVRLTDREPWRGLAAGGVPRVWAWFETAGPGEHRWQLPVAVLNLLGRDPRRLADLPDAYDVLAGTGGVFFGSAEDCAAATGGALIAWVKQSGAAGRGEP